MTLKHLLGWLLISTPFVMLAALCVALFGVQGCIIYGLLPLLTALATAGIFALGEYLIN